MDQYPDAKACIGHLGTVTRGGDIPHVQMDSGHVLTEWVSDRYRLAEGEAAQPPSEPAFDLLEAMLGASLKFRSGCAVKFVAYIRDAKPHCQLVLLNPATGNVVTRYATGKPTDEPHNEPGDILLA